MFAINSIDVELSNLKSPEKITILPPHGRLQPVISLSVAAILSKFLLSNNVDSSTIKITALLISFARSL
jgi:hypothetical protein